MSPQKSSTSSTPRIQPASNLSATSKSSAQTSPTSSTSSPSISATETPNPAQGGSFLRLRDLMTFGGSLGFVHLSGQRVNFNSSLVQSTSGLWKRSQSIPTITSSSPMFATAAATSSECSPTISVSRTSWVMSPIELPELSTFRKGMGRSRARTRRSCLLTKEALIKIEEAPQSNNARAETVLIPSLSRMGNLICRLKRLSIREIVRGTTFEHT